MSGDMDALVCHLASRTPAPPEPEPKLEPAVPDDAATTGDASEPMSMNERIRALVKPKTLPRTKENKPR
jgi:hypothetical protein